VFAGT